MINLLPHESKKTLVYARRNTELIRIITGVLLGIAGIIVTITFGYIYLNQEAKLYRESIATNKAQLEQQKETETVARVQEISNSLKLVVDVLSKEVLFSELLKKLGAIMPPGTVLQDLSLSNELTGALELQAGAVDYKSATQVQVNLIDPRHGLFTSADLINIDCNASSSGTPTKYPCKVTLRALFDKNNEFLLLSPQAKKERTQ